MKGEIIWYPLGLGGRTALKLLGFNQDTAECTWVYIGPSGHKTLNDCPNLFGTAVVEYLIKNGYGDMELVYKTKSKRLDDIEVEDRG